MMRVEKQWDVLTSWQSLTAVNMKAIALA